MGGVGVMVCFDAVTVGRTMTVGCPDSRPHTSPGSRREIEGEKTSEVTDVVEVEDGGDNQV